MVVWPRWPVARIPAYSFPLVFYIEAIGLKCIVVALGIPQTDRQTDGQTDGSRHRLQPLHLRWRGNNNRNHSAQFCWHELRTGSTCTYFMINLCWCNERCVCTRARACVSQSNVTVCCPTSVGGSVFYRCAFQHPASNLRNRRTAQKYTRE